MSPASLLNSCSFDVLHPYANLCTIPLLWADWVPFTLATQLVSSQASWLQRPQQGGELLCTSHQTELGSLARRAGAPWKVQGLCTATGFKHVSVPVLPEQDSSSKCWAQPDSCLLEKKQELGVPRKGGLGEREAESMKNSQWPAKAKWTPGLVHVHSGGRGGEDTSKVSNYTPKSCALEKEITKEIPPKWRKEKSSKIQQVRLKGKEF